MGILSLDQDPYDPQYEKLLRKIVIKILSSQIESENIDEIFSQKPPLEIEPYISKDNSVGKNLRQLHIYEKGRSRNMREKLYYGFDCFVKLSGGNILTFLNLCEKAIDEEINQCKKQEKEVTFISAESQAKAFTSLSSLTFDKDVNVVTEEEFREMRSFILSFGKDCEKKGIETDSFEGSNFSLPSDINDAIKGILRKGFLHRFLLCNPEELIRININKDYIPQYGMLNPLFAPRFGISWMNEGVFPLTSDKIKEYMLTGIEDQPDYDHPYLGQKKLFPENPVFISISIKKDDRKFIERNNLLKGTVNAIHKEDTKNRPRLSGLTDEEICITARDLWKKDLHRFPTEIPKYIQKAIYTVHDITPIKYQIKDKKEKSISTGVVFEIGLSLGYKSPFFIFHHCRYEPFDEQKLPKLLKDWEVNKWDLSAPEFKNMSFKEWYREAIHQHGFSYSKKHWPCPFDKEKKSCDYERVISKKIGKAYISFQDRNMKQRDYLIDLLSKKYQMYEISPSDYPMNDWTCRTCFALQSCIIKIIDCTEAVGDFVVELGLAEAVDYSSVICAYDAELRDNPVLMRRAFPRAWRSNTYKVDIENSLEDFMKKFRFGRRK